ncbi:MAG: hypothetical protein OEQ39_04495 [Gammaproteobacteria bacterium]|nr:hypothetical protein [Gammaproteobacteria bacterium]
MHTPGPWHEDGLSIIADYTAENGNRHHCHVADVTNRNEINRAPSMEEYANARLIAAAPDLLNELKAGIELEAGDLVGAEFKKARNAWLRSARAAIEKATKP